MEGGRQCILVLMGASADGKKELIAIQDGQRESEQSWKELLLAGEVEANGPIAAACGELLGQLHAASWNDTKIATQLDDRSYFEQLARGEL